MIGCDLFFIHDNGTYRLRSVEDVITLTNLRVNEDFVATFDPKTRCRIIIRLTKRNSVDEDVPALLSLIAIGQPLAVLVILDLIDASKAERCVAKEKKLRIYAAMRKRDKESAL